MFISWCSQSSSWEMCQRQAAGLRPSGTFSVLMAVLRVWQGSCLPRNRFHHFSGKLRNHSNRGMVWAANSITSTWV